MPEHWLPPPGMDGESLRAAARDACAGWFGNSVPLAEKLPPPPLDHSYLQWAVNKHDRIVLGMPVIEDDRLPPGVALLTSPTDAVIIGVPEEMARPWSHPWGHPNADPLGDIQRLKDEAMPEMVIKATKDRPLYLFWSTVTDAHIAVFDDRAELIEYLAEKRPYASPPESRVARADRYGSSGHGRWDEETISVVTGSPDDGWYHIRRDRLVEYAEALLAGDEGKAQNMLECWQRHGEDDGSGV